MEQLLEFYEQMGVSRGVYAYGEKALEKLTADIRTELLLEIVDKKEPLQVLFETWDGGIATGHTPSFIEVSVPSEQPLGAQTLSVLPHALREDGTGLLGTLMP